MAIGAPQLGGQMNEYQVVVDHISGERAEVVNGAPVGEEADRDAMMQAIVSALATHPDLTIVLAHKRHDAYAEITPEPLP